jgi:hypothetical protein
MRQTFGPGNRPDTQPHEDYLSKTRTRIGSTMQARNEARHGYVKEAGGRERESVGQRAEGTLQAEECSYAAHYRRKAGRHVHRERPAPGHTGVDQDREVPDAMRDLVRCDGKGRDQTKGEAS